MRDAMERLLKFWPIASFFLGQILLLTLWSAHVDSRLDRVEEIVTQEMQSLREINGAIGHINE